MTENKGVNENNMAIEETRQVLGDICYLDNKMHRIAVEQKILTLEQKILTLEQKILTVDQKILPLGEKILSINVKVWLPAALAGILMSILISGHLMTY